MCNTENLSILPLPLTIVFSHSPLYPPTDAEVLRAYAQKHLLARDANARADAAISRATAEHDRADAAATDDTSAAKRPRIEEAPKSTSPAAPVTLQPGVTVRDLKKLFCGTHALFSGSQQQCAYEFLGFFLDALKTKLGSRAAEEACVSQMGFTGVTKVQCSECLCVKYTAEAASDVSVPVAAEEKEGAGVKLEECLSEWASTQVC